MFQYGVLSGPYFVVFGLNIRKYGPEKTPYLDNFHAVIPLINQEIIMGHSKEIKQNLTGPTNFDICFCVIFSCCDRSLTSRGETKH